MFAATGRVRARELPFPFAGAGRLVFWTESSRSGYDSENAVRTPAEGFASCSLLRAPDPEVYELCRARPRVEQARWR
eukprot:6172011-Pleurochrysis_carterae.AAC.1